MKDRKRTIVDPEPVWEGVATHSIIEALNWYTLNKDDKDAAKYLGIKEISIAKKFMTLAWTRRMKARGCVFDEVMQDRIAAKESELQDTLKALKPVKQQSATNVISIQERVQEKTDYYIMELEAKFDEFMLGDYHGNINQEDFDPYKWMVDAGIKPMHASRIAQYFNERAKQFVHYIDNWKTDEYISESFAKRGRKWLLHAANFARLFASDAEKIASNASKARAPRKKKPVSIERKVKNLKYLEKYDDLKLQSISPSKIPGAMQLWVYNTKTRQLGVYNALDGGGLDVKGSAILNFAFETSIGKTLRKPAQTLKIVTDGGKIALRKALDGVNSKPKQLNGRINKDMILLRVL